MHHEREPRSFDHPEVRMLHWKNAGVVAKTQFTKNFKSPPRLLGDRKTRRSVAANRLAGNVLQQTFGNSTVFAKISRSHLIDQAMAQTMTRNLVSSIGNAPDHVRVLVRHPTDHEEGCMDFRRVEAA